MVGLVGRNRRRYGGYIVHLGIVLMFLGFAGGSFKLDEQVLLKQVQLRRSANGVRNDGIKVSDDGQKQDDDGVQSRCSEGGKQNPLRSIRHGGCSIVTRIRRPRSGYQARFLAGPLPRAPATDPAMMAGSDGNAADRRQTAR
jgi:hypothetical protein